MVRQDGSCESIFYPCYISPDSPFKGIVKWYLTGVETRLKRSALMNYIVAKLAFWILKEHHHERSTKPFSASKQQLNWTCWLSSQNPANDGLRTMILEI